MELPSMHKSIEKSVVDKSNETRNDKVVDDPLSVSADPLSGSLASDPLTAALIDPLATTTPATTGGIFDAARVTTCLLV